MKLGFFSVNCDISASTFDGEEKKGQLTFRLVKKANLKSEFFSSNIFENCMNLPWLQNVNIEKINLKKMKNVNVIENPIYGRVNEHELGQGHRCEVHLRHGQRIRISLRHGRRNRYHLFVLRRKAFRKALSSV